MDSDIDIKIMNEPIFKLEHLNGFSIIEEPGSAIVRVASDRPTLIQDSHPRYLINLRVISKENLAKIQARMGNREEVSYRFIRDLLLTGSIFEHRVKNPIELPTKGEQVIITFDYVDDDLKCTHVSLIPRKKLKQVDIEKLNKSQELFEELSKDYNFIK
jgi:hypothetical protein